jgi:hypothetical protein
MLARIGSFDRPAKMMWVGSRDVDEVDIVIRDYLLIASVASLRSELIAEAGSAPGVATPHSR